MSGYTLLSNDMVDALCQSGDAYNRVMWAVYRKTKAWQKNKDSISISQIIELTGLSRRSVFYAINKLEKDGKLKVSRKYHEPSIISWSDDWYSQVQDIAPLQNQKSSARYCTHNNTKNYITNNVTPPHPTPVTEESFYNYDNDSEDIPF